MNKVIDGAVYNTDTAILLSSIDSGHSYHDFEYYTESLFRTKAGKYFLYGSGNGNSRYGEWHGNSGGSGEKIMPFTYDEAKQWGEKNLNGDEYIKIFGDPEDDERVQMSIILSSAARKKLEVERALTGDTLSYIINRLVMELDTFSATSQLAKRVCEVTGFNFDVQFVEAVERNECIYVRGTIGKQSEYDALRSACEKHGYIYTGIASR